MWLISFESLILDDYEGFEIDTDFVFLIVFAVLFGRGRDFHHFEKGVEDGNMEINEAKELEIKQARSSASSKKELVTITGAKLYRSF